MHLRTTVCSLVFILTATAVQISSQTPSLSARTIAGAVYNQFSTPQGFKQFSLVVENVQEGDWVIVVPQLSLMDPPSGLEDTYAELITYYPWLAQENHSSASNVLTTPMHTRATAKGYSNIETTGFGSALNVDPDTVLAYFNLATETNHSIIDYAVPVFEGASTMTWWSITPWWNRFPISNGAGYQNLVWAPTYGGVTTHPTVGTHLIETTRIGEAAAYIQSPSQALSFLTDAERFQSALGIGLCVTFQAITLSIVTGETYPNPLEVPTSATPGPQLPTTTSNPLKIKLSNPIRICIPIVRPGDDEIIYETSVYLPTTPTPGSTVALPYNFSAPDTANFIFKLVGGGTMPVQVSRYMPWEQFMMVPTPANADLTYPISIEYLPIDQSDWQPTFLDSLL